MNVNKSKYRLIKEHLSIFGKNIKTEKLKIECAPNFWETWFKNKTFEKTWDYIIIGYLAYHCNEEERQFIIDVFFNKNSVFSVCEKFYISEKTYYSQQERILDDLIFFAGQEGLLSIDLKKESMDIEAASDMLLTIDDTTWKEIKRLVYMYTKRITKSMRNSVEAMTYVTVYHIPWCALPAEYGNWKSVYNRYIRWSKIGLWERICDILTI